MPVRSSGKLDAEGRWSKPRSWPGEREKKAKSHEEDKIERRCDFVIDGDELLWAVQELWKANRFLGR